MLMLQGRFASLLAVTQVLMSTVGTCLSTDAIEVIRSDDTAARIVDCCIVGKGRRDLVAAKVLMSSSDTESWLSWSTV